MPVTGLQFSGAHKVCAIGGFIPVIGAGFDIIDASLYGLEGDKIMQTAAISGAALNLFGSKWLFSGASSSLDNFAEAGVKYTDDAVEIAKIGNIDKYSLSNLDARKWYLDQERKIPEMLDESLSLEQQAKQAFSLRNKFKTQARELISDRELAQQLYVNEKNLTWEKIVQKQKDKGLKGDEIYKEIIASSQRSRQSVNESLGLK